MSAAARSRGGLTLLEAVVALVIFLVGLIPLVAAYQASFKSIGLGREHGQALLIAQSVLEEAQARVATSLSRFYGPQHDSATIRTRAAAGAWRAVFAPLAHGRRKVVSTDRSEISTYFQRVIEIETGEQRPLDRGADADLYAILERYWVTVSVQHEVQGAPIDSDGKNGPETDMCEVEVIVSWAEPGTDIERSSQLSTIYSLEDHNRVLDSR